MPIFFLITVAKVFNGRQTALRRLGRLQLKRWRIFLKRPTGKKFRWTKFLLRPTEFSP
jgi:hypothetical protein